MKGSCLSLNKIYADSTLQTLQTRVNFISSKRKRKWITFDNKLQLSHPHHHSPKDSKLSLAEADKQQPVSGKTLSHSKWKSMELQDLKTKRYQLCKQDSERNMVSKTLLRDSCRFAEQWICRASSCGG